MSRGKIRLAATVSLIVVISLLSPSEGRKNFEAVVDSQTDDIGPFEIKGEDSVKPAKPPALLDGLDIQGGQISPLFDPNVFDYEVALSGPLRLEDLKISAKFPLGMDRDKYKVKIVPKIIEQDLADLQSQTGGNEARTIVEIHVSADEYQSVTYFLNVGKVSASVSDVWRVLFQIIFWAGVVLAAAVVVVFLYGLYLSYSGGILTGHGQVESFSNGGGQYERAGNSR